MAAIAAVEAQLGEPLREDGPPLGLEFDPLPPGAFSTNGMARSCVLNKISCFSDCNSPHDFHGVFGIGSFLTQIVTGTCLFQ